MFNSKLKGQAPFQMRKEDNRVFETGQAVVEYLLVFVALALITVVSLSAFYPKVKATGEKLFAEAMERIAQ